MALKNFTQFTPQTVLSATDYLVGYRNLDEIRSDLDSMSLAVSGILISKGFLPGFVVGSVKRSSYKYTIGTNSPVNAVSGADDFGLTLTYTPGQVEVYRNGAHLANSLDYLAVNSTQITNLSTLNLGDIVEVVGLSGTGVTVTNTLTGFIGNLVQYNYRYTVAPGNTITPGSTVITGAGDFGTSLYFNTDSFQVYLNGSHLVRDLDYSSYNTGTSLTLGMAVANGDTVEVVSLSSCRSTQLSGVSAFAGIGKLQSGNRVGLLPTTGTGVVTISARTSISDFNASDWTNGSHISQWSNLSEYLSAVVESNKRIPGTDAYVQYVAKPGSVLYQGAIYHPNEKIYMPGGSTWMTILDPEAGTVTTVAFTGGPYTGGVGFAESMVLAPNGKIYCVDNGPILAFDPSNNTSTTFGNFSSDYEGGVLAPNGKIYFIPDGVTAVLRVDPSNNTWTTLGNMLIGGNQNYQAGTLAPNGKIYLSPANKSTIAIIDPATDTITEKTYANLVGNLSYGSYGGKLGPDGKIYMFSNRTTVSHAILDPVNETVTTINVFPPANNWTVNQILHPNGKFYSAPFQQTYGLLFDPETRTHTTFFAVAGLASLAYQGTVRTKTGKIVLTPYNSSNFAIITVNSNNGWDINVATNPFFNKL